MSGVFFVSDLHLGHKNILRHTAAVAAEWPWTGGPLPFRGGPTVEAHDAWVIESLLAVQPNKRTLWYILGDVAMTPTSLELLRQVPGRKVLVLGNHDEYPASTYLEHFEDVRGGFKKYNMWITHMPLHPDELRGKVNLHGHCHHNSLLFDERYRNVCIEWLPGGQPVSLDELRGGGWI